MIRRLAHLCLYTDDAPRLVAFYEQQLGLPVHFTLDNAEGTPFGWYLNLGETTFLEIFDQKLACRQWGGEPGSLDGGQRYRHFCLEVVGLPHLKSKLESRGVKVSEITEGLDGSFQAWVNDPDGNAIELMEYTGVSLQLTGGNKE